MTATTATPPPPPQAPPPLPANHREEYRSKKEIRSASGWIHVLEHQRAHRLDKSLLPRTLLEIYQ